MQNYLLYFHRNPITNGIFYVGIGGEKRPYSKLARNKFWKKYVAFYGDPVIEIVETGLDWETACSMEKFWINNFGRRGFEKGGCLVNQTLGGEGVIGMYGEKNSFYGKKHTEENKAKMRLNAIKANTGRKNSEETKKKMSESAKGKVFSEEHRRKISEWQKGEKAFNYGKKFSEETRKKMSAWQTGEGNRRFGKENSEAHRKRLSECNSGGKNAHSRKVIDTSTGIIYDYVGAAAEAFNINRGTLSDYLRGKATNKTPLKYYI